MFSLTIDLNDEAINRAVSLLEKALGDTTDLMDEIGGYVVDSVLDRFETEKGPDGQGWKPSIRARHEGGKTLTDSGHLRSSIQHIPGNGHVAVGTNLIYAGIHQKGDTISAKNGKALAFTLPGIGGNGGPGSVFVKSVKIPARPFMGLNDEDKEEISAITLDWLQDKMEAA